MRNDRAEMRAGGGLRRFGPLCVVGAMLSGCGAVSLPGQGPAPDLYTLTPKSTFRDDMQKVEWQLVVEEPEAAGGLDNVRIAVRPSPTELKYFTGARWTERAPKMVQTLLVESFENSGKIVAVGRQSIGLRSDYNLKSDLREFQAEYFREGSSPVILVRLNVKLILQPRQQIVASRTFEAEIPSEARDIRSVVKAFDAALGDVLRDVVEWTLTAVDPEPPQS